MFKKKWPSDRLVFQTAAAGFCFPSFAAKKIRPKMKREIDLSSWPRRDHFHFFRTFEEPFFGATARVRADRAFENSKRDGRSFFLFYLHKILRAANAVEAFRLRIEDGERVFLHQKISASPTIARPDGTFGFAYMDFFDDFEAFEKAGKAEIARVEASSGLVPAQSSEAVIHFSAMPFLDFSAVSHARAFRFPDSIPKITVGKLAADGTMPVSVHLHHALADGADLGRFFDFLQRFLNE